MYPPIPPKTRLDQYVTRPLYPRALDICADF